MAQVDILLATCNGGRYLGEQLLSLERQTFTDWHLIAGDDRSDDQTLDILRQFSETHPGRVTILPELPRRLGACANFSRLLEHSSAGYFMFCDQDDVWLPEKIRISIERLRQHEATRGNEVPLLVHTDLRVCDGNLQVTASSFWRFQNLDPFRGGTLPRMLMQNTITGCTLAGNRALREAALPVPAEAIMHDWWLGLVAVALGAVEVIPEQMILYRQHGANTLGARSGGVVGLLRKMRGPEFYRARIAQACRQAQTFLAANRSRLPERQREIVEAFARLPESNCLARRLAVVRHGFFKTGWLRNLALMAVI